jgi:hypothetical protein
VSGHIHAPVPLTYEKELPIPNKGGNPLLSISTGEALRCVDFEIVTDVSDEPAALAFNGQVA